MMEKTLFIDCHKPKKIENHAIGYCSCKPKLCLLVFSWAGPGCLVNCLTQLPVCHIKMEEFCKVPIPRAQQGELPAFSPYRHCRAERQAGKL